MRRAAALALVGALCLAGAGLTLAASNVLSLDSLTWGVTNANGTIGLKTKLVRPAPRPRALRAPCAAGITVKRAIKDIEAALRPEGRPGRRHRAAPP
jgi:hypothetical protein